MEHIKVVLNIFLFLGYMIYAGYQLSVELNDIGWHVFNFINIIDPAPEIVHCQQVIHEMYRPAFFFPVLFRKIRVLEILDDHPSADLFAEIL